MSSASALPRLARLMGMAASSARGGLQGVACAAPSQGQVFAARSTKNPAWGLAFTRAMTAGAEAGAKAAPPPPPPPSGAGGIRLFQAILFGGLAAGGLYSYSLFTSKLPQPGALIGTQSSGDYGAVRKAIAAKLDADYDDGSYGPVLVRLAWHASGTYDKGSKTGGSNGATMRFSPECDHGANAGLATARKLLEPIKQQFPWISYADLWTLAGVVAIEEMGGPIVPWRPGRTDAPSSSACPPDGRLPDASKGADHIRNIFYRMGFDDREIVALSGAHTLGRCHTDRSGYTNPWTNAPTTFSNLYFQELTNNRWRKKKWSGPEQYEDKSGNLMMLPTDMTLLWDSKFKKWVNTYAKDEELFFKDFAAAFGKMLELGVPFPKAQEPAPAKAA